MTMDKLNHLKRFNESDEKLKQSDANGINNEYVIINKTELLKRIEELEKIDEKEIWEHMEFDTLKHILSQSTPLIPEIEKAIEYGLLEGSGALLSEIQDEVIEHQESYITDLKLDI
jgi:hypothetical protein